MRREGLFSLGSFYRLWGRMTLRMWPMQLLMVVVFLVDEFSSIESWLLVWLLAILMIVFPWRPALRAFGAIEDWTVKIGWRERVALFAIGAALGAALLLTRPTLDSAKAIFRSLGIEEYFPAFAVSAAIWSVSVVIFGQVLIALELEGQINPLPAFGRALRNFWFATVRVFFGPFTAFSLCIALSELTPKLGALGVFDTDYWFSFASGMLAIYLIYTGMMSVAARVFLREVPDVERVFS